MPQVEEMQMDTEKRIFEELTFVGEHILHVEKLLQEVLHRLAPEPGERITPFSPRQ